MKHFNRRVLAGLGIGFIIGTVFIVGLRFITYKSNDVHYHANFSLYINGQHEEFKSFTFYEEVQTCTSSMDTDPKHRVHMHNQENDIIHVHAPAVTWGAFFANLGYTLGDNAIETDAGVFNANKNDKLTFMLNGQKIENISNRVIDSEDRLLVNYGNDDDKTLQERFGSVASTAAKENEEEDPASCGGSVKLTPFNRLKKSIAF